MNYTKSLIEIPIPGPFILLGIVPLTLLYIVVSCLDYYLYCRINTPYAKYKHWHRLYHVMLPFVFAPKIHQTSTAFIAFPWFIASVGAYSSQLYKYQQAKLKGGPPQGLIDYVICIGIEGLAQKTDRVQKPKEIRIEGVRRLLNNVIVMGLGTKFLTPMLLENPKTLFTFPWYSLQCIWFGFLMGFKGYTLMLSTDIGLAVGQIITGVSVLHVFDLPFLATSPKDFWGNRWNLVVRNLFRKQLYTTIEKKKTNLAPKRFLAFVISGLMHEAIMTLANRTITLEQLSFFVLHGIAVYAQTLVHMIKLPKPVSIFLTMVFFGCTSKLFIGPFLRFEGQCALFGQHAFI